MLYSVRLIIHVMWKFFIQLSPRRAAVFDSLGREPVDVVLRCNTASAGWRHKNGFSFVLYLCRRSARAETLVSYFPTGLRPRLPCLVLCEDFYKKMHTASSCDISCFGVKKREEFLQILVFMEIYSIFRAS